MAKPRENYKSNEEIWKSIKEKIKPLTLEQLERVIKNNEGCLKFYQMDFPFKEAPLSKDNLPVEEITKYYFPESAKNPAEIFLSGFGRPDLAKKISDNPKEARHLAEEFRKQGKIKRPSGDKLNELAIELNLSLRAHTLNTICLLNFRKSVNALLIKGERDDIALTNAISIDKLLVTLPLVQNRIKKASLEYDQKFFSLLSKAINKPLKMRWGVKTFRLALLASALHSLELSHLTYEEILRICDKYNIYKVSSAEALSKQLNRVGFRKFERTKKQ